MALEYSPAAASDTALAMAELLTVRLRPIISSNSTSVSCGPANMGCSAKGPCGFTGPGGWLKNAGFTCGAGPPGPACGPPGGGPPGAPICGGPPGGPLGGPCICGGPCGGAPGGT
uniref:Uncharacterized protein n=1 Tax=Glossina pallidipes TaxID=7398 RepID=A0A1B0A2K5_GLOPL